MECDLCSMQPGPNYANDRTREAAHTFKKIGLARTLHNGEVERPYTLSIRLMV